MSRLSLACAIVLIGAVCVLANDRRPDPSHLTIMTLNAEFLFDGVPPEVSEATFPHKGSREKAEEHMRRVAEVIARADPDIVCLCEVESLRALTVLNDKFLKGRGYRPYLSRGTDSATGQNQGLLTRVDPIDGRIVYDNRKGVSGTTVKSLSKDFVAKFAVCGLRLGIVSTHLRAQPRSLERKPVRQAQADAATSIARELAFKGYSVIMLGDFNDFDGAPDAIDRVDSTPITNVLATMRAMDPKNPADDLKNVAALLPKSERYTCFWDKNKNGSIDGPHEFSSIDHCLVSPGLVGRIESVKIPHDHDPREVTDHFPIVVKLRCGPASHAGR